MFILSVIRYARTLEKIGFDWRFKEAVVNRNYKSLKKIMRTGMETEWIEDESGSRITAENENIWYNCDETATSPAYESRIRRKRNWGTLNCHGQIAAFQAIRGRHVRMLSYAYMVSGCRSWNTNKIQNAMYRHKVTSWWSGCRSDNLTGWQWNNVARRYDPMHKRVDKVHAELPQIKCVCL